MVDQPKRQRRRVDVTPSQETEGAPAVSEGIIHVQRVAYGRAETSTERIPVPVFQTEPARVRVATGVTRNMQDFNSARVDVVVELPCLPVDSEIRRAYEYASTLLDELLPLELEKAGVPPLGG